MRKFTAAAISSTLATAVFALSASFGPVTVHAKDVRVAMSAPYAAGRQHFGVY